MITFELVLPHTHYPIHIGTDLLTASELIVPHLRHAKAAIVTNTTIAPLYLDRLVGSLQAAGVQVLPPIVLPDGEHYKNMASVELIFDGLLAQQAERTTSLIALGGGVIGDMTGFAAACYQRGMPFIQIPTTLLAQVDSSVGGKTGINHPAGKNMIGAFHQPQMVLADMRLLDTLPERELRAGLAEVIKHALLGDFDFFCWLETHYARLLARDHDALAYAVERCCRMKAAIVSLDEREHGARALLNLGHTFGHAIEGELGYGTWLHGEAVAAGMVLAADLSHELGYLSVAEVARVAKLIHLVGLPTHAPSLGVATWLQWMGHDKKVQNGQLRFVTLQALGQAVVSEEVPLEKLIRVLTGTWVVSV